MSPDKNNTPNQTDYNKDFLNPNLSMMNVAANKSQSQEGSASQTQSPITLPKGGGAIQSMGEKFQANPVTGTGSMTVPIAISQGRGGFTPQLALSYDSGSGNSEFGLGWSVGIPAVTRKTQKELPRYFDNNSFPPLPMSESNADEFAEDTFILSGAEDLVPYLETDANGAYIRKVRSENDYIVTSYRPRTEGLFAKIERWFNKNTQISHWRTVSKENVTSVFGYSENARIAHPDFPSKVFSWKLEYTWDGKGNAAWYDYSPEDTKNLTKHIYEKNRHIAGKALTQKYLRNVYYGNRTPIRDLNTLLTQLDAPFWLFRVYFNFGELGFGDRIPAIPPGTNSDRFFKWHERKDPFSVYNAGFEIRTYRLCRRIEMYHNFKDEQRCVKLTELRHNANPTFSYLTAVRHVFVNYNTEHVKYVAEPLPSLEFTYSDASIDPRLHSIEFAGTENLPAGFDSSVNQTTALNNDGLPGVLTESNNAWYFNENLGDVAYYGTSLKQYPQGFENPEGIKRPHLNFGRMQKLAEKPSLISITQSGNGLQGSLNDLDGDGIPELMVFAPPFAGYYKQKTKDEFNSSLPVDVTPLWQNFKPFSQIPNINFSDPNLRTLDLTGDGNPDILITEQDCFVCYTSAESEGWNKAFRISKAFDDENGPALVFDDGSQSIYLADMCGDGQTAIVRIRNGKVEYWANLGYGRFSEKITMENAPKFDHPEKFNQNRIRLADIDGSGTADIIYLGDKTLQYWFNQSGNRFSDAHEIAAFPKTDNLASVNVFDLFGNGTSCIVWSSPLPKDQPFNIKYIDITSGQKPHLLVQTDNGMGVLSRYAYTPSTKFYLKHKQQGTPWTTRLPFPVQVLERTETLDQITGARFVSLYEYRDGYYDGYEREFRGFGCVEQFDAENYAAYAEGNLFPAGTNTDELSHVPPVHTKTWFHLGTDNSDLTGFENLSGLTNDFENLSGLTNLSALSPQERREAARALRGSMLRQEIYADDASDRADMPYAVTEKHYKVSRVQALAGNKHAVFFTQETETLSVHYERAFDAPRISHQLNLKSDAYGNVLRAAQIAYPRGYMPAWARGRDGNGQDILELLGGGSSSGQQSLGTSVSAAESVSAKAQINYILPSSRININTNINTNPDESASVEQQPIINRQEAEQFRFFMAISETDFTNVDSETAFYRLGVPYRTRAYEANGWETVTRTALNGMVSADVLNELCDTAPRIAYSDSFSDTTFELRLTAQSTILYHNETPEFDHPLPLAAVASHALPYCAYTAVFDDELLAQTLGTAESEFPILKPGETLATLLQEGKYVRGTDIYISENGVPDLFDDMLWYKPSAIVLTEPQFLLPTETRDVFGNASFVDYDAYKLFPVSAEDALGNVITAQYDYRNLQAHTVTDINGNVRRAEFDGRGTVTATYVHGLDAQQQPVGDTPDKPSQVFEYDLFNFVNNRLPNYVKTTLRVWHAATDLTGFENLSGLTPNPDETMISYTYTGGLGQQVLQKVQAEDTENGNEQWVGTGRTVLNNKGKAVKQYEPYFSDTFAYESEDSALRMQGVTPVMHYDPLGRLVRTDLPDGTFTKTEFTPWEIRKFDTNDTVLESRWLQDVLPLGEGGGGIGTPAGINPDNFTGTQRAALLAAAHANTPQVLTLDSAGRVFLTADDNGRLADTLTRQIYTVRDTLDSTGNKTAVTDAKARQMTRHTYDMAGRPMRTYNIDSNTRKTLPDAADKPMRTSDSRVHILTYTYDALQRPVTVILNPQGFQNPEGLVVTKTEYGTEPTRNNVGQVYKQYDQSGVSTVETYDFNAAPLHTVKQFVAEYQNYVDWSEATINNFQINTFSNYLIVDALQRPVLQTLPDGSAQLNTYNKAGLLETVARAEDLTGFQNLSGLNVVPYVTAILYNARGQRTEIVYGNGARTRYEYNPYNFRLINLKTTRNGDVLQDISYIYDPEGNITEQTDAAQQTQYFRNAVTEPRSTYEYDALYRLIKATGREHNTRAMPGESDFLNTIPLPDNGSNVMRTYTQTYKYDELGNLLQMKSQNVWTRDYVYNFGQNNYLLGHDLESSLNNYEYDNHGNMTKMPHLQALKYDYANQLHEVELDLAGNKAFYNYDASGTRVRKTVVKGNITETRYYVGSYELFEKTVNETLTETSTTIHVNDDKEKIALIYTNGTETNIRFQLTNHLGSSSLELDEHAHIISYEEYHPFGTTSYRSGRSEAEVSLKRYKYVFKELDNETGLYYYGMRYYAPWLARFISVDPLQFKYPELTPFQYASNAPISNIDLDGAEAKNKVDNNKGAWDGKNKAEDVMSVESWHSFVKSEIISLRENKVMFDCADLFLYLIAKYHYINGVELRFKYSDPLTGQTTRDYSSSDAEWNNFDEFTWGVKEKHGVLNAGFLGSFGASMIYDYPNGDNYPWVETTWENRQVGDAVSSGIHVNVLAQNAGLYTIYDNEIENWYSPATIDDDEILIFSGSGNYYGGGDVGVTGRVPKMGQLNSLGDRKIVSPRFLQGIPQTEDERLFNNEMQNFTLPPIKTEKIVSKSTEQLNKVQITNENKNIKRWYQILK